MSSERPSTGFETFLSLRARLFGEDLAALTGGAASGDEVVGVAMEMVMPSGTALVFGLRDGSASIYLSSGGGSLGGQGRPPIDAAARRLVETARGLVAKLPRVVEHPLPAAGRIRLSIFTPAGVHAAEAAESELVGGNELLPLFRGAHEIITGFRLVEASRAADEPLYVNMLLTALARGHASSVVLTAGEPLPDPATLTRDAADLDWFASAGLAPEAQSSEKVFNVLLEAAGFRRFHLRRTEGRIRAALEAHDRASTTSFDFAVTKGRTDDGRVRIEIAPVRAS
jgi:hypothetical protein